MEANKRVHVWIRGRVQGVCFRMETRRAAMARGVKGWVRNLPDGSVEAVFEGKPEDVDGAAAWCHEGPPFSRVEHVDMRDEPFTGRYASFDIVR